MKISDIRSPNQSRGLQIHKPATRGKGGIVTAQNRQAAHIGAEVLAAGGNAVDAAVAVSFAIGVLEPWMSGIGGVGALLIRSGTGEVTAIDAGARAPAGLDPTAFPLTGGQDGDLFGWPSVLEDRNVIGARAICIPGMVRGMAHAHARFGRMDWADLVAPAVALAGEGPVVDAQTTAWIAQDMGRLLRNPACAAWFLPGGLPPAAPAAVSGQTLRLPTPQLAQTLAQIAAEGADALYTGDLAARLSADVQALGGWLDAADLASFAPREMAALAVPYRDHLLHILPELNGGVTVAMALRDLAARAKPQGARPSPEDLVASCDALARAWDYRFKYLGDGAERTLPSCTTHFSVVDRDGMAVSQTQTLLSLFGSGVVSPSTGILLNNGVNWFDPRPGRVNSIAPGVQALANYAPMILTGLDDVVALGGSGGRKILPALYQAVIHLADHGQTLEEAIAAPRYDLSAPPMVVADQALGADAVRALAAKYPVSLTERMVHPNNFTTLGAVRRKGGVNEGMAEPWHLWADAVAEGEALFPGDLNMIEAE